MLSHCSSIINIVFALGVQWTKKQQAAVGLFFAPGMLNLPLNVIHAECHIV